MDFPIFHLDLVGNRMLIAVIATIHVIINHALAVGFIPVVTILEYRGFRERRYNLQEARQWDDLARKMMLVGFVITTSLGALTGVGIWFSASLVNPAAIGSLIRVFYNAWFSEWFVFMLEVSFIMIFFLRWEKSNESEQAKKRHLLFGAILSVFSWLTMVIVVAILSFMMDPGHWPATRTFFSGFFNPLYIPQLYFRTPLAMMMGGAFALFLIPIFAKKGNPIRERAVSLTSLWLLIWTPVCVVGAVLYRAAIPEAMIGSLPTAVATQAFSQWYDSLLLILAGAVMVSLLIALWGFLIPKRLVGAVLIIPLMVLFICLGAFERVREFIRKPFVIGQYMYANGLRVGDYPLFQEKGILPFAAYVSTPQVTTENKIEAGENVFLIACSRCHTVKGINSLVRKFKKLTVPGQPLNIEAMKQYIPKMHKLWYYMPPFPGNLAELDALAAFILDAEQNPRSLPGAQSQGIRLSPDHTPRRASKTDRGEEN